MCIVNCFKLKLQYQWTLAQPLKLVLVIFSITAISCNTNHSKQVKNNNGFASSTLTYAKRFNITNYQNFTSVTLFGSKDVSQVTATFILYKNQKPIADANAFYIKIPVKRVACMSSIYGAMLSKICELKSIVAIDNVDYYTNTYIQQNVLSNKIKEISKGPSIEVEKAIALNPDLIFTFGMGNPKTDVDAKLSTAKIPVSISLDHLEETPLARAEWIKFFACFYDKKSLADSLFSVTEKKYNTLMKLTKNETKKPTVLTEIKFGDTWYVPSGKSYVANLIADAGGDYLWKDDKKSGSTPLTFEHVYAKAKDCDVWLNAYNVNTKQELLSYDERYKLFAAFNKNTIYNNNKTQNAKGFSNYWETGITNPDAVLADMIAIFHPTLLPNHTFTYYKHIE